MNIDTFFSHYQITENPFAAEEARLDPVFGRSRNSVIHPEFPKILGEIDKPSTSVVFGEKGSGKTALRLLIGERVAKHNQEHPDKRTLLVAYDDFNPYLDNLLRLYRQDDEKMLAHFRLEDHQDAILSLAVTKLVNAILGEHQDTDDQMLLPDHLSRAFKAMGRNTRLDLMVLAGLYDRPHSGSVVSRWKKLRRKLRLGWHLPLKTIGSAALVVALAAAGLGLADYFIAETSAPWWLTPLFGVCVAGAVLGGGYWSWWSLKLWNISRRAAADVHVISRAASELASIFSSLKHKDLDRQPIPRPAKHSGGRHDSRYQLTRRFVDVLRGLGYAGGMMVLVDRVDEPTLVSGDAKRMKAIIWPMFDNKFFQQDDVGFKLLLPIELRHLLYQESAQFFQEARMDKQNMVDRLTWSGATLYDLCSARLNACRPVGQESIYLTDLFTEDVNSKMLVDALDQMHQPRDAFKFLYAIIQEHCQLMPEGESDFKIALLTLDSVRRNQSQRVQELHRGLGPA